MNATTMTKIYQISVPLILLFSFACKEKANQGHQKSDSSKSEVALNFINDYTSFCKTNSDESNSIAWIQRNKLVTNEFKAKFKNILHAARQKDEEMGLGFDPIFNAQDFPEHGFVLSDSTAAGNDVIVTGKDLPLKVILKMKFVTDTWLVDGAGIVNIP